MQKESDFRTKTSCKAEKKECNNRKLPKLDQTLISNAEQRELLTIINVLSFVYHSTYIVYVEIHFGFHPNK